MDTRLCGPQRIAGMVPKSVWTPALLTGIVDYIDSTTLAGATNSTVASWAGVLGVVTFAQATEAAKPTVSAVNGGKSVLFDGANHFMSAGDQWDLRASVATVWAYCRRTRGNLTVYESVVSKSDGAGSAGCWNFYYPQTSSVFRALAVLSAAKYGDANWAGFDKNDMNIMTVARAAATGNVITARTNAASGVSVAFNQDTTDYNTTKGLALGSEHSASATSPFKGHIMAVGFMRSLITDAERAALYLWLKGRWAL